MRYCFVLAILACLFGLTGCVEIIDDISINDNGSGTFKYTINLSSSKVKINSYLALDSLNGKKVPSLNEISNRIEKVVQSLQEQEGISNLTFDSNYDQFIFKLKLDFSSVDALQTAIQTVIKNESNKNESEELDGNWLQFKDQQFTRSIPRIAIAKIKDMSDSEVAALKQGSYMCISRFSTEIASFDNDSAKVSKNKLAIMLRTDPYSLVQNTTLLDNKIYLRKPSEHK
ncbi:MAG: hypothetical protein MK066_04855 [Crocinitomicaceae bacterium]|nr:hypothetical protein [Crocinitomicaceae bacterium]